MKDMILLVEPLIPALRRYASGLLRDREAADDLVQDCLERVIRGWPRRRNDDARSWTFTILHNLAMNRLKQRQRRGRHAPLDETDEASIARPGDQEDRLHHRDLIRALGDLSEEQRSVLLLVSVEDLSYAETAQVLGIPVGTVMSRLSRGRDRLEQLLEGRPAPALRRVK
jgi:RNA polymerase sigma-70 factor (ECF subfamily)